MKLKEHKAKLVLPNSKPVYYTCDTKKEKLWICFSRYRRKWTVQNKNLTLYKPFPSLNKALKYVEDICTS